MAKTHYLGSSSGGSTQHRKPGQLILTKPIDTLTAGELDLLLLRQKLEIQQLNADKKGIGYVGNYEEVIKTVNHCIRNADNPDEIMAIGEALEDGYSVDEAINGIGKSAKKIAKQEKKAQKKKETGKTAAGRLLQKVGKGIKAGAKAVVKVVTAPLRLVAKGAMEIYLPKAAPFFLYLFAATPDTLPDLMKRKRQKAEKFKNFVVKGLGMKEDHFMKIVSNGLEKQYGKPPAEYLAEKLVSRVSGIGNPKAQWRHECDQVISGIGKAGKKPPKRKEVKPKPAKKLKPVAKKNFNTTLKSIIKPGSPAAELIKTFVPKTPDEVLNNIQEPIVKEKKAFNLDAGKLLEAGEKLASGNIIGAALGAITWLISKISSLIKGEKMDPITADDFPDVERDAANVFEYQDMKEDYSNLDTSKKEEVKEVATEITVKKLDTAQIINAVEKRLSFLNVKQKKEVVEEITEGPEAIDEREAYALAKETEQTGGKEEKTNNNGVAVMALAAVAVMALSK
jgi:hypothetical protein